MIGGKEQYLNAGNSTDCADKLILYHSADELITTSFNDVDSTYFSDDAAGGLIAAINYGKSTDSADP